MEIPTKEEFYKEIRKFKKHVKRDAMYNMAAFLVEKYWGDPSKTADALGVLLLTWNQAFYRYGLFDYDKLEESIVKNFQYLEYCRNRDIISLSDSDEKKIMTLFNEFMEALKIVTSKSQERKSAVSASKALHLIAPDFFPLWDYKISREYGCCYSYKSAEKYISFCKTMKTIAEKVKGYIEDSDKSILKLIDEYNYSKYTKEWD